MAQKNPLLHNKYICYLTGEFANNLPDYQKIDIMMFVMSKVPMPSDEAQAGWAGFTYYSKMEKKTCDMFWLF